MSDVKVVDFKLNLFDDDKKWNRIYHYTSPEGLLGILDRSCIKFRFTRFDCVNDIDEGENVNKCYIKACRELFENKEIDSDFYKIIIKLKPDDKIDFEFLKEGENKTYGVFLKYQAYICCFSLVRDSLPMWNYYVKDGSYQGYCLGFTDLLLNEYLNNEYFCNGYKFIVGDVVYDEKKKSEIIKEFIRKIYEFKDKDQEIYNSLIGFIPYLLKEKQYFFKSDCFSHEQEIRAVIYIPTEIPKWAVRVKEFPIEYVTKNGYVIPFINVFFNNKLYVKEITIGPLSEKKISHSTVESFLKEREYKAEVRDSKIPIRF